MRKLSVIVIFLALVGTLSRTTAAQTPDDNNAYVRVGHFVVGGGAVDITVNGEPLFTDLAYPTLTEWTPVPSGTVEISLSQTASDITRSVSVNLAPGSYTTFAAFGANFERFQVIAEDYTPSSDNAARVTVLHALAGAPVVDVLAGRSLIVTSLAYPGTFGSNDGVFTAEVPAGTYNVQIIRAGTRDEVVNRATSEPGSVSPLLTVVNDVQLTPNVNAFIAFIGTPGAPTYVIAMNLMAMEAASEVTETPSLGDLLAVAAADGRFTTLISAFEASRLSNRLTLDGSFTLFAPTDDAFRKALASLNRNPQQFLADTDLLETLLLYHVVEGALASSALAALTSVETLSGESLTISADADGIVLNGRARVTTADIPADNGVIHVIDAVLIPPDLDK